MASLENIVSIVSNEINCQLLERDLLAFKGIDYALSIIINCNGYDKL